MNHQKLSPGRQIACVIAAVAVLYLVGGLFHLFIQSVPNLRAEFEPPVFRPWPGWTATYMIVHPLWFGVVFTIVYLRLFGGHQRRHGVRTGLQYGLGVFLAGSFPVYALIHASLAVSTSVILCWVLQSLCQYATAGLAVGWIAVLETPTWRVKVTTELRASAEDVWERLKRRDTFLFVTRGLMRFEGADEWPEILMAPDVVVETRVRLLHVLPGAAHRFRIVRVDEAVMEIDTKESGGMIRVWNHSMKVQAVSSSRCRYTDRVELQAGALTPIVWLFASLFYRYRHFRWRLLVAAIPPRDLKLSAASVVPPAARTAETQQAQQDRRGPAS